MMDDVAANIAQLKDKMHLFLDARQPTPDTAPQILQLRRQLSAALKTLFDYTKEFEPRALGSVDALVVDEALTSEQIWAQLVQQNRASAAFWKPVVRQVKAELKGAAELSLPMLPRVDALDDVSSADDQGDLDDLDDIDDAGIDFNQLDDVDDVDDDVDDDHVDDDDVVDDDDDPNSTADNLNDDFFDFDDMEAFADEAEALAERENAADDDDDDDLHLSKRKSKRSRRKHNDDFDDEDDNADDDENSDDDDSDDDEESLDLMAPVSDEKELASAASLKYSDFFGDEKPRRRNRAAGGGRRDDDENDDNAASDDEFADLREYQRVDNTNRELQRAEAADDDAGGDEQPLPGDESSPFERAQRQVAAKIAKMEAALVAERSWALRGEVAASSRPANSLIETEVEYDHATRPAPVITDEHTRTLEDMIRARVRDSAFDDVVRRTEAELDANKRRKRDLPELSHEKSQLSLAEVYAQDFVAQREEAAQARLGDDGVDAEAIENAGDALDDQRKEIRQLFDALCARLDALSHYRARPRLFHQEDDVEAAKAQPNVAAARLEHAMPVAMSTGDTLAPEERFAVQRKAASDVVERPAGAERRARKNAHAAKRSSQPQRELSGKEARAAALKQVRNSANVTVVEKRGKNDVGVDSERGSTALFRQLQREVSGEIASTKKSAASKAAASAALATKRSGKAAQFKM